MKIQLNKQDNKELQKLIEMKYLNMEASDFLKDYLDNDYLCVDKDSVKELVTTSSMKEEEAFFTAWLLAKDIDPNDAEIRRLKENNRIDNIKQLDANDFKNQSKLADMNIYEKQLGNWKLAFNYYEPYEGFLLDDTYADEDNYYAEINSLGFFKEKVSYLTVNENDRIWMSITPYEIRTMAKAIEMAHGNVLAYGLGLGYFPLMAMKKENVKSVTIIEKDKKVIHLFESEILKKIRFKDKLNIINADAFKDIELMNKDKEYDFIFFDIYHDASDGIYDYIRMKNLEYLSPKSQYCYWIENSLLIYLRRIVLTLLEENLEGFTSGDYMQAATNEEALINSVYHTLKDISFHSYDEIKSFLSDKSLRNLASRIKI